MILASDYSFGQFMSSTVENFWQFTGFHNCEFTNLVMLAVGCFFVWLAIKKNFEPLRIRNAHRQYTFPAGHGDRHI